RFLETAGTHVHAVGCRGADGLDAYAVLNTRASHTLVLDLECARSAAAGAAVIRYLVDKKYPAPFRCSFVPAGSPAARVLSEAGFHVTRRSHYMTLDLTS